MKKKIAVILFNLGGPDKASSIQPFLFNFFMDRNIIGAPLPVRWLLAKFISARRSRREAGTSYSFLGGSSPLLDNSQAQANALERALSEEGRAEFKVFICMRYWHPLADKVVQEVKDWGAERAVLLPLYPQYSTATTKSSFEEWGRACRAAGLLIPTARVCCYPLQRGFVAASVIHVKQVYEKAMAETGRVPRVLFSAHGLPEKTIKGGDPYQWQCEQSAHAIAQGLGIPSLDWQICYQSRVGPLSWIGPSTEEALKKAAQDGVPVVILPHAFTQEHVETLVEIEIEYREKAHAMGVPGFYRVPTVSAHPDFISGLAGVVMERLEDTDTKPDTLTRLCPEKWCKCAMDKRAGIGKAV